MDHLLNTVFARVRLTWAATEGVTRDLEYRSCETSLAKSVDLSLNLWKTESISSTWWHRLSHEFGQTRGYYSFVGLGFGGRMSTLSCRLFAKILKPCYLLGIMLLICSDVASLILL